MIDLHCHLLPETMCGPEGFHESIEMCRLAVKDGVHTIVATPRWDTLQIDEPPQPFSFYQQKMEMLRREVNDALSIQFGFLLRFSGRLPALIERYQNLVTLGGGRYALVSLPQLNIPQESDNVWREIRLMGYRILLARPECSPALRQQPERLSRWIARGMMLQIDAASIVGSYGREVQRFALRCLQDYERQTVVASNARDAGKRWPSLKTARTELIKVFGPVRSEYFLQESPAEIIHATEIKDYGKGQRNHFVPRSLANYWRALKPTKTVTETF